MATVGEHYDEVLSDFYTWMSGGFEAAIRRNTNFFREHRLSPSRSGIAIDLGAGCGFQSIPLARAGYSVTAIDIDAKLLGELKKNRGNLRIKAVQDDLVRFDEVSPSGAELIVCMTDTILHLRSKEDVTSVFKKASHALEDGGRFVLTFRDLTHELEDLERFLIVRSDDDTIFTCFLEYEPETVKVHDIIHTKRSGEWETHKSFYRKLRLSERWITEQLSDCGLGRIDSSSESGLITVIAR